MVPGCAGRCCWSYLRWQSRPDVQHWACFVSVLVPQLCIMLHALGLWPVGPLQHWPQLRRALRFAACHFHLGCRL